MAQVIAFFLLALGFAQGTNQAANKNTLIDGTIRLGGLVPIHSKASGVLERECGGLYSRFGIQRLEAMLFAVDQINANPSILPNITLGIEVYDTCSSETKALDKAVHFISGRLSQGSSISASSQSSVVGVIGACFSSVSIQIAHLLRLFQLPQISFDSTSVELSDKKKFEYFSRTVPHDGFQAKAIVDVIRHFNWTYISSVYSDDTYGIHGMEALREEAKKAGICIATAQMIKATKSSESSDTFLQIIDTLKSEPKARTVVVFTSQESHIRSLLLAANERNIVGKIQWVGSDAWGNVVWLKDLQHLAHNAITVSPKSVRLKAFEDYFTALRPETNTRNPWFKEYWQLHFNCSLGKTINSFSKPCSNSTKLTTENSNIDMRSSSAIDAVNAFARALHAMHADVCSGSSGLCKNMINISGLELLKYIRNLSFDGATGHKVAFDSLGDVDGIYDILLFKKHNNIHRNSIIGLWANKLKMNDRVFLENSGYKIMKSSCAAYCSSNEIMVPIKGKEACCWECVPCKGNSYVVNQTTCVRCAPGYWPIKNGQGCERIKIMYFGKHIAYSVPTMMLACFGIVITVFVIIMLARNDRTPIVKASGRELSYLILSGILLSFIHTFIVVIKPSDAMCIIRFFGCSIAFSICYAAIFIKTNRISRIFNRRNIAKRPILILPTSQLVLVLGVVCVQVLLLFMLTLLRMPKAKVFYPKISSVYLDCDVRDLDFGLSQVYNFILILVCTLYAFKTRKIPSNFNEAKFIAFAMYSTCVIWLAFLALYFMKSLSLERSLILCVGVSLVAYVLLGTLFGPKVYILLFKPHRNVRKPVTSLSLSSISQTNNVRCPKCTSHAAGGYTSGERGSDRVENSSSDDPALDGNYSNRISLLPDSSRPQSLIYCQDGQPVHKAEVEKVLKHMRKELQAAKYALKSANEKLLQKEQEYSREQEEVDDESTERKRPKAIKEVKSNDETTKENNTVENDFYQDNGDNEINEPSYPLCKLTMDEKPPTNEAENNSNILLTKRTESELRIENGTLNSKNKCMTCTKKKESSDKWKRRFLFPLSKNTEHSKSSIINSCPECGKTFNDSIDPLSSWRRSFSLPDIDLPKIRNGVSKHEQDNYASVKNSSDVADKRSKQDHQQSIPSALLTQEFDNILPTPIESLVKGKYAEL